MKTGKRKIEKSKLNKFKFFFYTYICEPYVETNNELNIDLIFSMG